MSWASEPYVPEDAKSGVGSRSSRPPHELLIASLVSGLIGLVVGVTTRGVFPNLLGWLVSGFGALVFLGLFVVKDSRRSRDGLTYSSPLTAPLRWSAFLVAMVALTTNAWKIADVVSRW